MTPHQIILKRFQQMLPQIQQATEVFVELEELVELVTALETVEPIDSILSEEYQTVTDQTKKAEWVAEKIAQLKEGLKNNA